VSILNARRLVGPINQFPVSGSAGAGGGGGSLTINNNTDGNILSATGDADTISGLTGFKYLSSANTISGSGQIKANSFAFAGTNAAGTAQTFKLSIVGGILQVEET